MPLDITVVDPRRPDVLAVLRAHLAFVQEVTPQIHVHALDVSGLVDPAVTMVGAARGGVLLGIGALRDLGGRHAELKSMHTLAAARGQGVGRGLVSHLLGLALERGYTRVSLETGTHEAFAPARGLYASIGFSGCEPFGAYTVNPFSRCMSIDLGAPPSG